MLKITEEPRKEEFLQSRIDQQVELICILKQRADEYLLKYQQASKQVAHLENDLQEKRKLNVSLNSKCELYEKNICQLERRQLFLLNQCHSLKKENASLESQFQTLQQHLKTSKEEYSTLKVMNFVKYK